MFVGGVNGLETSVDATFISKVGSVLDGVLANEFLITLGPTEFDARGHSGKKLFEVIRNASYSDDVPAQGHFDTKDELNWLVGECRTSLHSRLDVKRL